MGRRKISGCGSSRWTWLGLTVLLVALSALDVLALARREALVAAFPLALRQPLVDILVIALPLLAACVIRAAGRFMRAPFVVAHPSVPEAAILTVRPRRRTRERAL